MELDITNFVNTEETLMYSNSIANSGNQNIGKETWENAKACNKEYVTDETFEEIKDFFLSFGAWDEEELSDHSELNALLIQWISAELNEESERLFYSEDKVYIYIGE